MRKMRRRNFLKLILVAAFSIVAYFGFAGKPKIEASSAGPLPSHTGAPGEQTCHACHSSFPVNSGGGSLIISGLPKVYRPHQEISLSVTLSDQNAKLYGFQLTAIDAQGRQAGEFVPPPQNPPLLQLVFGEIGGAPRPYIEHTAESILPTQANARRWDFKWRAPLARLGQVGFFVAGNAADGGGDTRADYIYARTAAIKAAAAAADFDGDGISEVALFRPSNGFWYRLDESGNFRADQFGTQGDKPAAKDYDGDGRTDIAVFRPSNGTFYILESEKRNFRAVRFGQMGDIPVSADYDGDGQSDIAVFRPAAGQWFILESSGFQVRAAQFGQAGDAPVTGDYDGDARDDIGVFRAGQWFILRSRDNSVAARQFGLPEDLPVVEDYDGDGRADIAVFRPSNGIWYLLDSTAESFSAIQFGARGDVPAPGDYDGDGRADAAVFRRAAWYILNSSTSAFNSFNFGVASDLPILSRQN